MPKQHCSMIIDNLTWLDEQVGNSCEHEQNPCGLSGLMELEEKMAEFYVTSEIF